MKITTIDSTIGAEIESFDDCEDLEIEKNILYFNDGNDQNQSLNLTKLTELKIEIKIEAD